MHHPIKMAIGDYGSVQNCFPCHEQSDWPKSVKAVFIISLYIQVIRSLSCDPLWVSSDLTSRIL